MNFWRRVKWVSAATIIVSGLLLVAGNWWVIDSTEGQIITRFENLPVNPVGLVLGTSKRLPNGNPNPYFDNRMASAAMLYKMGKVGHIIVSGDNRSKFYNEPMEMKRALVILGVPESAITLDYAGLRTLDSVVRSKEIFGQQHITIITQPFHSYRALFISRYFDIDAVALVESDSERAPSLGMELREYLARAKAILDLYVLKTAPRHLGVKEPIGS